MRFGRKEEEGCVRLQGFLLHTDILKKKGYKATQHKRLPKKGLSFVCYEVVK